MTLTNLLIAKSLNFQILALFICHLFIDGHFQTGCILHDSNVLQISEIMSEIQSICANSIPWLMVDVRKPVSLAWQPNQRTDRILQLIFIDAKNPPQNIGDLEDLFTCYRLFVFSSVDKVNFIQQIDTMKRLHSKLISRSVIIHYNSTNVTVLNQWNGNENIERNPYSTFDQKVNATYTVHDLQNTIIRGSVFDSVFSTYNENWAIGIRYEVAIPPRHYVILDEDPMFANYFYWDLKAKYINMSIASHTNATCSWKIRRAQHKNGKVYREFSSEYETLHYEQIMYDTKSLAKSGTKLNSH